MESYYFNKNKISCIFISLKSAVYKLKHIMNNGWHEIKFIYWTCLASMSSFNLTTRTRLFSPGNSSTIVSNFELKGDFSLI